MATGPLAREALLSKKTHRVISEVSKPQIDPSFHNGSMVNSMNDDSLMHTLHGTNNMENMIRPINPASVTNLDRIQKIVSDF